MIRKQVLVRMLIFSLAILFKYVVHFFIILFVCCSVIAIYYVHADINCSVAIFVCISLLHLLLYFAVLSSSLGIVFHYVYADVK